jgi:hypothetical protein
MVQICIILGLVLFMGRKTEKKRIWMGKRE